MTDNKHLTRTDNFIILDEYESRYDPDASYQTEAELEKELIHDLKSPDQKYEYASWIMDEVSLLENARKCIQELNNITLSDAEWQRFVNTWLNNANDRVVDKAHKIHKDYICDFMRDDGESVNISLFDKKRLDRNKLQVINQFNKKRQESKNNHRYDVVILVNGIPLVHIEFKKRGTDIRKAFYQIDRYGKGSLNANSSLFKYVQIFIISNGTDTRYFSNTTGATSDAQSFDFTMNWALANNQQLNDLKDFTATFLQKDTLLKLLFFYSVLNSEDKLLIMRPYQIAATERILDRIQTICRNNALDAKESGGYVWHATSSGKTLTSFKTACLACDIEMVEKVIFVVDRKDLDNQTMREYQKFSPDSVSGSENTSALKDNLEAAGNKIVVTTIQKLNRLMKSEPNLKAFRKRTVLIFDECHRSQFGEAQKNIRKVFRNFCQFGFTGTPIFEDNAIGENTTASVFGERLHSYIITDAIRDKRVLKFHVEYNDVRPNFRDLENENDKSKLKTMEQEGLLHNERVGQIVNHILDTYHAKTSSGRFNAMFAVDNIKAAKVYYEAFNRIQTKRLPTYRKQPLKVAVIFSMTQNEPSEGSGEIPDENFDITSMEEPSIIFMKNAIEKYNVQFNTNCNIDQFQEYYQNVSNKMKKKEIDLLIVVGMFTTGFDVPRLNTLFVDKRLRYHGLIQAFSRTNRIYDRNKAFGNIVTFRPLENNTNEAIKLFGDGNARDIILERTFEEYLEGYEKNGKKYKGFREITETLNNRFPDHRKIEKDEDKKEFAKLFGEYLRFENKLKNYYEFSLLKDFQKIDPHDVEAIQLFKTNNFIKDGSSILHRINIIPERKLQDYISIYHEIRYWLTQERELSKDKYIDWDNIVFEVELLKNQEINLDYILDLIYDNAKPEEKDKLIEKIKSLVRSRFDPAKEDLLIKFIDNVELEKIETRNGVMDAFYTFARSEQLKDAEKLISEESLVPDKARRFMAIALEKAYVNNKGLELRDIMPKMSPMNPQYAIMRKRVFDKISNFVNIYKGLGVALQDIA